MKLILPAILAILAITASKAQTDYSPEVPLSERGQYSVSGKVLYADGSDAGGVQVSAFLNDGLPLGGRVPTVNTDTNGNFTIKLDGGSHTLCPNNLAGRYLNPTSAPFGLPVGGKCETVDLPHDEGKKLSLRMSIRTNTLYGKIANRKTLKLPPGSAIYIYRPVKRDENDNSTPVSLDEAEEDFKHEVQPNSRGFFTIDWMPEGRYYLRIEIPGRPAWFFRNKKTHNESTPIDIKNGVPNEIEFSFTL